MKDWMTPTFSARPFREQAQRRRTLAVQGTLADMGRAPGDIPVRSTAAGVRGIDLAQVGAAQMDRAMLPGVVGLHADLNAMDEQRRLIAEEAMRRDRMARQYAQAAGQAHSSGAQLAGALTAKYMSPYSDRFLSGRETQEG